MDKHHTPDGHLLFTDTIWAYHPYVLVMRNDRASMLHPDGSERAIHHLGSTRAERLAAIQATLDEGLRIAEQDRRDSIELAWGRYFTALQASLKGAAAE